MSVIWVFKPIGWTPKDCVLECQKTIDKKMIFSGRLDPMAYGLLPIIANNTNDTIGNKEVQILKESLQGSYKTYRFKLVMSLESDTYDILGLIKKRNNFELLNQNDLQKVKELKSQTYPAYSSYHVFDDQTKRKLPLWKLAKESRLPEEMPKRDINVEYIKMLNSTMKTNVELKHIVKTRIESLRDKINFRNEEIMSCWDSLLNEDRDYCVYEFEAKVSTGTYIRSIGNLLGGVSYDIFRTSVNDIILENSEEYDKFTFSVVK